MLVLPFIVPYFFSANVNKRAGSICWQRRLTAALCWRADEAVHRFEKDTERKSYYRKRSAKAGQIGGRGTASGHFKVVAEFPPDLLPCRCSPLTSCSGFVSSSSSSLSEESQLSPSERGFLASASGHSCSSETVPVSGLESETGAQIDRF